MNFGRRSMDNPINWSFRIGRLFGIDIRIHLWFIFGIIFLIAPSMEEPKDGYVYLDFAQRLAMVGILFGIVLLHEFGHCWGARKTGGEADEIMLWPLGGLATVSPPNTPKAHGVTVAAGPMVNVIICALVAAVLTFRHGGLGAVPWNPLHPYTPVDLSVDFLDRLQWWLRGVFAISYILLLFNLLPIYPLDGGRMLQVLLWPKHGHRRSVVMAARVGMWGSIGLAAVGIITHEYLMIAIAFFGYLTCYFDRQAAQMEMDENFGEFGYDFSQGYTSLSHNEEHRPRRPGYFQRRREKKAQARMEREAQRRRELAVRVDGILTKISTQGMASLTSEERRILKAETERQRTGGSQ